MSRLRTFIAIDVGKPIRERLVALQDTLARATTDVKWVEPENLHVTLLFLGEVNDRDLPDICRGVATACRERAPFPLAVETVGCFGNPRRPRTLWVGLGAGTQELVELHDALETTLLDLGCYRREDRPYTPHVTLGRVKSDRPNDQLAAALAKKAEWQAGETTVNQVLVLSSELTSQGPVYTVLGRAKMEG